MYFSRFCRSSPVFLPSCAISHYQTKALTIGKLMEIAPAGTVDPTPFIYDSTMYTMAGLMVSFTGGLPNPFCLDLLGDVTFIIRYEE